MKRLCPAGLGALLVLVPGGSQLEATSGSPNPRGSIRLAVAATLGDEFAQTRTATVARVAFLTEEQKVCRSVPTLRLVRVSRVGRHRCASHQIEGACRVRDHL
jgi:hypothetical protein